MEARRGRSRSPNSDGDEARKLRRKLRDLEDKITTDRARSLSRTDDRRRSRSPDDIESLKRENRELRKTLQRGGFGVLEMRDRRVVTCAACARRVTEPGEQCGELLGFV